MSGTFHTHYDKVTLAFGCAAAAVLHRQEASRATLVATGLATLCAAAYFHRYSEDPKNAPTSLFPRVPRDGSATTSSSGTARGAEATNVPTSERFLVVGAGFVGLGIAAGLKRHEIAYDQVDKEADIGGNWRYGVFDTVHIISSRRTTEFKDFPMPASYPDFPSGKQMREYLDAYAQHYQLREHLEAKTSCVSCVPIEQGKQGWDVTLEKVDNEKGGKTERIVRRYKGVIIALGHHWCMRFPEYEGLQSFTGRFAHSKQIKHPATELADKRVLVIGGGNSACDLATEAGRYGTKSCISVRRGVWFFPRAFAGIPLIDLISPTMPMFVQRLLLRIMVKLTFGSFERYGLPEPTESRPFDTHPTINSDLLQQISLGRVSARKGVKRFLGGLRVEFNDGTIEEFDVVIAATGYRYSMPMLSEEVVQYVDGVPQLYGASPLGYYFVFCPVGGQVRYGAGPLISLAAQAMGHFIKTQEKLHHPLGDVFRAIGFPPMTKSKYGPDVLEDPIDVWGRLRTVIAKCHRLPMYERVLMAIGRLPRAATPN